MWTLSICLVDFFQVVCIIQIFRICPLRVCYPYIIIIKKKPNKGPIVTSFFRFKIFYVHKIRFFLTLMTKNAKMVKNQLSNWNEKFLKIILLKVFWLNLCTFKILIISVQPKNKNIEKFNPDNFWSNSCSGHI